MVYGNILCEHRTKSKSNISIYIYQVERPIYYYASITSVEEHFSDKIKFWDGLLTCRLPLQWSFYTVNVYLPPGDIFSFENVQSLFFKLLCPKAEPSIYLQNYYWLCPLQFDWLNDDVISNVFIFKTISESYKESRVSVGSVVPLWNL